MILAFGSVAPLLLEAIPATPATARDDSGPATASVFELKAGSVKPDGHLWAGLRSARDMP
jgi:hypothetical protein